MSSPLDRLRDALVGRYDLDRLLDEGIEAYVFAARDVRHGRDVVIRLLKPDTTAIEGTGTLLRRVRVMGQLSHPHLQVLLDSGEVDGLVYCVVPAVAGESLRARLDRERQLPIADAVRIVREVAEGLGAAWGRGVAHGEVRPRHVQLQSGHALLTSFGAAVGGAVSLESARYLSPERARGVTADAAADQYSLGCLLYECLAGQPPFGGTDVAALTARHARERVPGLRVVRATVPERLEAVVLRLLAKTPDERFGSWDELVARLRDVEMELAVERSGIRRVRSAPPGPRALETPPPSPPPPRHGRRLLGTAVVACALAAGLLAWRVRASGARRDPTADPAPDPRRVAVLYFTHPSGERALAPIADGLTEDLIASLAAVPELVVVSRNGVGKFRTRELPRDSVARLLRVGTLVLGEVTALGRDSLRVTARLVDGDGTEIRRATFDQPATDPIAARDELTLRVTSFLRERLGDEIRVREQRFATRSSEAWLLLQSAEQARKTAELAVRQGDTVTATARFTVADSVAARASSLDPAWLDPLAFRGTVAYRRSRLAVADAVAADALIARGLAFADSVLARDSAVIDALELRGNLRYWRWLLRLEPDASRADALLAGARADLERAVERSPRQAGAWGTLSHLYYQTSEMTDVLLAAQRAYESDAYLENAATILDRLFSAAYDLDQPVAAARWCDEGQRRFPADARFTICQLYLMTMRGRKPDVRTAWQLAASGVVRDDPSTGAPEFNVRQARMIVAMVLARAGLADSARAVIASARADSDIDPTKDLYHDEAYAQLLAGDRAASLRALKIFLAANPDWREGLAENPGWWFRDFSLDAEFQRVVGGAPAGSR